MTRRLLPLSALMAAVSLAAEPGSSTNQPSAEWIKRTKDRIELLLGPMHDTAPLQAGIPNPFRLPGHYDPDANRTVGPVTTMHFSDAEILARLAATLRINGLVEIGGSPQVIINQLSYKEGDLVAVREGEQATYLRVIHITSTGLTLELGKFEQTIQLK